MRFETVAVHAGSHIDPETGAVAPPIHLSTTFERTADGDTPRGFGYIRDRNPNGVMLEDALAAIDSAAAALAFSAGVAAEVACVAA